MHIVSQHLGEPLRGAEGLLKTVSFKATESMGRRRVRKFMPDCGGCNTKTIVGKGSNKTIVVVVEMEEL